MQSIPSHATGRQKEIPYGKQDLFSAGRRERAKPGIELNPLNAVWTWLAALSPHLHPPLQGPDLPVLKSMAGRVDGPLTSCPGSRHKSEGSLAPKYVQCKSIQMSSRIKGRTTPYIWENSAGNAENVLSHCEWQMSIPYHSPCWSSTISPEQ